MKNNPEFIDKPATLEAIRKAYGSVAAFCREVPIHPRLFYKALAEDLGRCRRSSFSRDAMERMASEGLLVRVVLMDQEAGIASQERGTK